MTKFVESRPFADPEAAALKLLEIARDLTCAQGWAYTGVANTAFLRAGGSVPEYGAGIARGIAHDIFAIDIRNSDNGAGNDKKPGAVKAPSSLEVYDHLGTAAERGRAVLRFSFRGLLGDGRQRAHNRGRFLRVCYPAV